MKNRDTSTLKKRRKDFTGFKKICENCKGIYIDVAERRLKYCSMKCFSLFCKKEYICQYCRSTFISRPSRNTKYCCRKCMCLGFRGRKYSEEQKLNISTGKLKGRLPSTGIRLRHLARWSRIRKKVLERDGFMCQICYESGLEVHHIKPTREYPDLAFEVDNLISLCKKCHVKTYNKEKEYESTFIKILGMV